MVTLKQLFYASQSLVVFDGDLNLTVSQIEDAVKALEAARESMDALMVKGRNNVDALLGCMLAIEAIIGEETNG